MTKIRMGSRDFILRYKRIPDDAPKAEFKQKKAIKDDLQTPAKRNLQHQKPAEQQILEPSSQMEAIPLNNKKHMMSQSSSQDEIEHKKTDK